jgi:hypothetical protein
MKKERLPVTPNYRWHCYVSIYTLYEVLHFITVGVVDALYTSFEDMSLEGFKSLTASMASPSTGWVYDRKLYTQSRNTVGCASEIVDPK